MGCTIFWAIIGGLSQWAVSLLGWEMNHDTISPKSRIVARIGFVVCALLGTASIAIVTYRSGMTERAHFALDLNSKVQAVAGTPLSMKIFFKNVGTGPSVNTDSYSRSFIEDDESRRSADSAIAKFKEFEKSHDIGTDIVPKDTPGYFMVAQGLVLSNTDFENIVTNIRVVYIVGRIKFKDDFGSHTQYICKALQRPVSATGADWGTCGEWDDEE